MKPRTVKKKDRSYSLKWYYRNKEHILAAQKLKRLTKHLKKDELLKKGLVEYMVDERLGCD